MSSRTLYLIRHATPDWNRKDIPYHLPPGPPLTELGLAEAEALGVFLQSTGIARLYASPMERACHTAQIAADLSGAALQVDERLMEWQPGDTNDAVWGRLSSLVDQALAEAGDHPVGLVSHGAPVGVILLNLGLSSEGLARSRTFDHNNPLPPAGAWVAKQDQPGDPWQLELVFKPQVQLQPAA